MNQASPRASPHRHPCTRVLTIKVTEDDNLVTLGNKAVDHTPQHRGLGLPLRASLWVYGPGQQMDPHYGDFHAHLLQVEGREIMLGNPRLSIGRPSNVPVGSVSKLLPEISPRPGAGSPCLPTTLGSRQRVWNPVGASIKVRGGIDTGEKGSVLTLEG